MTPSYRCRFAAFHKWELMEYYHQLMTSMLKCVSSESIVRYETMIVITLGDFDDPEIRFAPKSRSSKF